MAALQFSCFNKSEFFYLFVKDKSIYIIQSNTYPVMKNYHHKQQII